MTPRNLYILLVVLCVLGWGWLLSSFFLQKHDVGIVVCVSKSITDVPCPSCGTTRSVISFFQGDFAKSFYFNPLGVITSFALLVLPWVLLYDFFFRKQVLYRWYVTSEKILQKPLFYVPLVILLILNWIWNICKGL